MRNRKCAFALAVALSCVAADLQKVDGADYFCADVTCLAAAISASNADSGADRIFLQAEQFTLQTPLPGITETTGGGPLEIIGGLDKSSVIERHAQASPFSIFDVRSLASLTLTNVTVKRGNPEGINNLLGRVTLRSVVLTENRIGLVNSGGTALIESSVVSSNDLGISNHDGTMSVFDSVFEANGRVLAEAGISKFRNVTIQDNTGGIFQDVPDLGGELRFENVVFIRNRGSIVTNGPTELKNSTVAFNQAQGQNAALTCGQCQLTIVNSTISANRGQVAGGIARTLPFAIGTVYIQNSIVSGNAADQGSNADCSAAGLPQNIRSLGNNILGECAVTAHASDISGNPGLASFVEDERPGKSHFPLLSSSPAVDAANSASCPETDQLEQPRVGNCDVGAVEFRAGDAGDFLVAIDVRPGKKNNNLNPGSTAVVPVAILGSADFDPAMLDQASLRFGPKQAPIGQGARLRDVNRDGIHDLLLQLRPRNGGVKCGDTSLVVTGQTSTGTSFEAAGPMTTIGCKEKKPKKK